MNDEPEHACVQQRTFEYYWKHHSSFFPSSHCRRFVHAVESREPTKSLHRHHRCGCCKEQGGKPRRARDTTSLARMLFFPTQFCRDGSIKTIKHLASLYDWLVPFPCRQSSNQRPERPAVNVGIETVSIDMRCGPDAIKIPTHVCKVCELEDCSLLLDNARISMPM